MGAKELNNKQAYEEPDFFKKRPERVFDLVSRLTPVLNYIHEVNQSERFWLRLLSLQLRSWIGQKNYLIKENPKILRPLTTINSFRLITAKQVLVNWVLYLGKAILNNRPYNEVVNVLYESDCIVNGTRSSSISKDLDGHILGNYNPLYMLFQPDWKARSRWLKVIEDENDTFFRNVLRSIPLIYIEYFKRVYKLIPVVTATVKSFHYEHTNSIYAEYVLAKYQEAGSKICSYQTGGYMGEIENHPDRVFYRIVDELKTYGWKQHEKDVPAKAYRLLEYAESWRRYKQLLGKKRDRFNITVVYTSISEKTYNHLASFTHLLSFNIDRHKYPKILLRPRLQSKMFSGRKAISNLGVNISGMLVDNGKKPLSEIASMSDIIIQTNLPATNFLECLAVDQPVLAINTNSRPSKLFSCNIKKLYKLHIVFDSGEELVEFINSINDLAFWWNGVISTKEYQEFKNMFCGGMTSSR